MDNKCERIKNLIADFIGGDLPEPETRLLEQHLNECPECRDYSRALQEEDKLLSNLFSEIDSDLAIFEDGTIEAVDRLCVSEGKGDSLFSRTVESPITRFAAAAVVIFLVVLYFTLTLAWISEINECILYTAS